jgi:hypothetical protein
LAIPNVLFKLIVTYLRIFIYLCDVFKTIALSLSCLPIDLYTFTTMYL